MLELKVGDRVKSREGGVTGTVIRREHDFELLRYAIDRNGGEQSEIWPDEDPYLEERLEPADGRSATTMAEDEQQPLY